MPPQSRSMSWVWKSWIFESNASPSPRKARSVEPPEVVPIPQKRDAYRNGLLLRVAGGRGPTRHPQDHARRGPPAGQVRVPVVTKPPADQVPADSAPPNRRMATTTGATTEVIAGQAPPHEGYGSQGRVASLPRWVAASLGIVVLSAAVACALMRYDTTVVVSLLFAGIL